MVIVIAAAFLAIAGGRAGAAGQGPTRCTSIRGHSGTESCAPVPTTRGGARFNPYMQK
jgi:hypothetical protein